MLFTALRLRVSFISLTTEGLRVVRSGFVVAFFNKNPSVQRIEMIKMQYEFDQKNHQKNDLKLQWSLITKQ